MSTDKINEEIQQRTPLRDFKGDHVNRKLNINTITPVFKRKNGVLIESPTKVMF